MTKNTSWDNVSSWYQSLVGNAGMYYHQKIIIPRSLELLNLNKNSVLIDLACGPGFLANYVSNKVESYLGVDLSEKLINYAIRKYGNKKNVKFAVADISKPMKLIEEFTHAVCILALQNIQEVDGVFKNVSSLLKDGGWFLFVINHPCFRIPRLTSWGIDESKKLQYRRIDRYKSSLKIPINVKPSQFNNNKNIVWTYHYPLEKYINCLIDNNLCILRLEEWCSDKVSFGKHSKMENLARQEFPMFCAILAKKINLKTQ